MYQSRVRHTLSPVVPKLSDEDRQTLWDLFIAIGDRWELADNPDRYRLRHDSFLENRIGIDPLYEGYYRKGAEALRKLIADHGAAKAFDFLLGDRSAQGPSLPIDAGALEILRKRIVDEFIALRLALGGFKAFGAINYRGYFGGALLPGEAPPYRTPRAGS